MPPRVDLFADKGRLRKFTPPHLVSRAIFQPGSLHDCAGLGARL